MEKVAVITDSIACLTRELVEQYGIRILPVNFFFGGKVYKDWVDITPNEAYELFLKDPESFKSSSVSAGECLEAYREVSKQAKDIACVTVSSKISAVYSAAQQARKLIQAEFPQISIEVVDSQMATAAEGFVALAAARAAEGGKSLTEVVKAAEEIRERANMVVVLDTIRHVYRSGRIPKIAAQAGALLNIRPVLTFSSGLLHFAGAVRSRERGVERLLKMVRDQAGQKPVHMAVMHAYALDEAEKLKERVAAEFDCVELWLSEFSPVMGYACGTGTLGLAFYSED